MTADDLRQHTGTFFDAVGRREIDIYNEFSLQHEFGIWPRSHAHHPEIKIQFERPVRYFGVDGKLTKREIDLACFEPPLHEAGCGDLGRIAVAHYQLDHAQIGRVRYSAASPAATHRRNSWGDR